MDEKSEHSLTQEEKRLEEDRLDLASWRKWGPYLSERQWGTVREDYSPNGDVWNYLPHDHARSRAYRWGEDGIAGISDNELQLCFSLAFWNGKDPILKERLFGLNNFEGNHGEDVKEYYFYLDNVPSHSYMKYLYKYPQGEYPYNDLVSVNGKRTRNDFEYELLDTGIFNENKYFDVFIEYIKAAPEDILIQISVANRGPEKASLHLIPTMWFRNTWSWKEGIQKPKIELGKKSGNIQLLKASNASLGDRFLYCDAPTQVLFTENETNKQKLFGVANDSPYVKDSFHEYIVNGNEKAVNPLNVGTKAAIHHLITIDAGQTTIIKLRLSLRDHHKDPFGSEFDETVDKRKTEMEEFYQKVTPFPLPDDMRKVQRQAFAGLLWNKQLYYYSIENWLRGDPKQPKPPDERLKGRNHHWEQFNSFDIFSMPDKWEYPWFAAWDLAFHTVALSLIDPDFAKNQLLTLSRVWCLHPDGQIPAYEWSFKDVNPPVHAWAAMRVYQIEAKMYGRKDRDFLERAFQKLLLNFTWWVNRKDEYGHNIFEGGFLGLDNIGVFDRTMGPPLGGTLEEPDATGWMGMYCLNMLDIALELSKENPVYEDMATKFFEHFIYIADAINNIQDRGYGLWDSEADFYYGLLTKPNYPSIRTKEDSLVGVIPIFAVASNDPKNNKVFPLFLKRFHWFIKHRPEMVKNIIDLDRMKSDKLVLLSIASPEKLKKILEKVLDESEFLSPFGVRSVSKRLQKEPFVLNLGGRVFRLDYEPAESTTNLFGGNSNWRGPVWFPLNYLLIEALQKFYYFLGDDYKVESPVGSKKMSTLWDVSTDLTIRLIKIFLKDESGRRPVYGGIEKFQTDPHWKDYILFHEYFHGDNGAGLGASNQTGWTGLVAKLIQQYGEYSLQNKPPEVSK